jgi:hypothetical protein
MGRTKKREEPGQPEQHSRTLRGFSEAEVARLRELSELYPEVDKIVQIWEDATTSSAFDALVTLKLTMTNWNSELQNEKPSILRRLVDGESIDDTFKNALQYLKELPDLVKLQSDLMEKLGAVKGREADSKVKELLEQVSHGREADIAVALVAERNAKKAMNENK